METCCSITVSFQGLTHKENQDGFLVIDTPDYTLCAVFDGVSLSKNPRKGVEGAMDFIHAEHQNFIRKNAMNLKDMMYAANTFILNLNYDEPLTTYALAGFYKNDPSLLYLSNLGDSRIYEIQNNYMHCLTTDDTLWPGSNILTKCLGGNKLNIDHFREDTIKLEGRFLLLATDGFYGIIEKEQTKFFQYLNSKEKDDLHRAINSLIAGKNMDDATYIIIDHAKKAL